MLIKNLNVISKNILYQALAVGLFLAVTFAYSYFTQSSIVAYAAGPDLVAENLTTLNSGSGNLSLGDTITFSMDTTNIGDTDIPTFTSRFCLDLDDDDSNGRQSCMDGTSDVMISADLVTTNLVAGASETKTANPWPAELGTHTMSFCTDVNEVVLEEDDSLGSDSLPGNCFQHTFTVDALPFVVGTPDLVAKDIIHTGSLLDGEDITFEAVVENIGNPFALIEGSMGGGGSTDIPNGTDLTTVNSFSIVDLNADSGNTDDFSITITSGVTSGTGVDVINLSPPTLGTVLSIGGWDFSAIPSINFVNPAFLTLDFAGVFSGHGYTDTKSSAGLSSPGSQNYSFSATVDSLTSRFCLDLDDDDPNARQNCVDGTADVMLSADLTNPARMQTGDTDTQTSDTWTTVVGDHAVYYCSDVTDMLSESDESLGVDGAPASGNCEKYTFTVLGLEGCPFIQGTNRNAGEYQIVVEFEDVLTEITNNTKSVNVNIPAGHYDITLQSYDGGANRATKPAQLNETWVVDFEDGTGVVDTSGPSEDIPDGVNYANTTTLTNSITDTTEAPVNLSSDITQLVARHTNVGSGQSVHPVCVGLNPSPVCTLDSAGFDELVIFPTTYGSGDGDINYISDSTEIIEDFSTLPSGRYDVTMQSFDTYPDRSLDSSSKERWGMELWTSNSATGRKVGGGFTTDLVDGEFVEQSEIVKFDAFQSFRSVKAVAAKDSIAPEDGLYAVCAGFKRTDDSEVQCAFDSSSYDHIVPFYEITGSSLKGGYPVIPPSPNPPSPNWRNTDIDGDPIDITPGRYDVFLQSYDLHADIHASGGENETWYLEINQPDEPVPGSIQTAETGDLPNYLRSMTYTVETDFYIGTTSEMRAHLGAGGSIKPICAAFSSVPAPDLVPYPGSDDYVKPSSGWDRSTGAYDSVTIDYRVSNTGDKDTDDNFEVEFNSNFNNTIGTISTSTSIGILNDGETHSGTKYVGYGILPGDYNVEIFADSDDDVEELNENNNKITVTGTDPTCVQCGDPKLITDGGPIPAPDPGVSLSVTPDFVRAGESAELAWQINATYPMDCTIFGPDTNVPNFNPNDPSTQTFSSLLGHNIAEGTAQSGAIKSKSEFVLQCTEKISGYDQVFTASEVVETIGTVQER